MDNWNPERISNLRKAFRLTRRELGDLTGVTITTIYLWEKGQRKPSKTAEILLSRIEQELQGKKLVARQVGKEVKKHGRDEESGGGESQAKGRGRRQQSKEAKSKTQGSVQTR